MGRWIVGWKASEGKGRGGGGEERRGGGRGEGRRGERRGEEGEKDGGGMVYLMQNLQRLPTTS